MINLCFSSQTVLYIMTQQTITNYFKCKGTPEITMKKKRNLSLIRTPNSSTTPSKLARSENNFSPLTSEIIILSSDEEERNSQNHKSEDDVSSNSSNQTIIYTLTPKNVSQENSYRNSHSKSGSTHKQSPRSSNKFYSPVRKRTITTIVSPVRRNLAAEFDQPKSMQLHDNEIYLKASEGLDDKSKFLLFIISQYLKNEDIHYLFDETERTFLKTCFKLTSVPPAFKLVCRLYWRKNGWYKRDQLLKICFDDTSEDTLLAENMFADLINGKFLEKGTLENMTLDDFQEILLAGELKQICKDLKIKTKSKKDAKQCLKEYGLKTSNISSFYSKSGASNNSKRVLEMMSKSAGACYKMTKSCHNVFYKLYIISYLGMDFDIIKNKELEFMLLNVKAGKETFPVNDDTQIDKANCVFYTKEAFDNYISAHNIFEDFYSRTNSSERSNIVNNTYRLFKDITVEQMENYRLMPKWLLIFTPVYLYMKIMEDGLTNLKREKNILNFNLAVEILSSLLEQNLFRQHRRADWYNEKALILQNYLKKHDEAADVLIKGLESDLPEESKDVLRRRALKMANQKNINLDENKRKRLRYYGIKASILEKNLPRKFINKQPMESTSRGKIQFETRDETGRSIQGVEDYAMTCYINSGEFTHGGHWEGRMITTIFFLLFWDLIYSKPLNVVGIFLCQYQRYPIDMFSESFYENRKEQIDIRLGFIESSTIDQIMEMIKINWEIRPESEQSGINREIGLNNIEAVSRCLGPQRLTIMCKRLAHNYKYSHSGFPDLTLWNIHTKKIKFVEVKSDQDKPSMKQIQWMSYLIACGIHTEFCYVGANSSRKKSRQSVNINS